MLIKFFSFVFIFGVVYMIHDARQFSLRDDIKISEAEFQSNRETRANIEIIESLEQDFTSLSRENLVSENDLEQDKLQEPAATQETSEVQKANFIIQKDMKSPENTTFTDVPEETTQTFVN